MHEHVPEARSTEPLTHWRFILLPLLLLQAWAAFPAAHAQVPASETYDSAAVDSSDAVAVWTHDHRTVVIRPDSGQVGIDRLAISPDHHAVGWLVLYPNCCTSYPIPLELRVYAHGTLRAFTGIGLPVWSWAFEARGEEVSLHQETVHGGYGAHYELRDVATGRLVARYEPADSAAPPPWVVRLRAAPTP